MSNVRVVKVKDRSLATFLKVMGHRSVNRFGLWTFADDETLAWNIWCWMEEVKVSDEEEWFKDSIEEDEVPEADWNRECLVIENERKEL